MCVCVCVCVYVCVFVFVCRGLCVSGSVIKKYKKEFFKRQCPGDDYSRFIHLVITFNYINHQIKTEDNTSPGHLPKAAHSSFY